MATDIVSKLPPNAVNFSNKTLVKPVKLKKTAKVLSQVDINQINMLLLGTWGSGKTFFVVGLLKLGYKILYVNTDFGQTGLETVRNELTKQNLSHLESQIVVLYLDNYEEVIDFLEKPESYFPDIYTFGIDILVWDGFDNFQHNYIGDFVGEMVPDRQKVSEAREAGLQFEQQDWGQIKNATTRSLGRFFKLHNKLDGTVWHKIICCKSKTIQKKVGDGQQFVEVLQPNIQGAAQTLVGAAFSIILLTVSKADSKGNKEFKYLTFAPGEATCKNRGFNLPIEMEANPEKVWTIITEQLKIERGKKDSNLVDN